MNDPNFCLLHNLLNVLYEWLETNHRETFSVQTSTARGHSVCDSPGICKCGGELSREFIWLVFYLKDCAVQGRGTTANPVPWVLLNLLNRWQHCCKFQTWWQCWEKKGCCVHPDFTQVFWKEGVVGKSP